MSIINKLTEYFSKFPGIGPRQAKRFAYFLLIMPEGFRKELAHLILDVGKEVSSCSLCFRFFSPINSNFREMCGLCTDESRDVGQLMVVEKDVDAENVERGKIYNGHYFILGGSIPILEKNPEQKIRLKKLKAIIEKRAKDNALKEIILALSVNPEGEHTSNYIMKQLSSLSQKHNFNISVLGRGLSTGTELEYSDPETIKNALQNRA